MPAGQVERWAFRVFLALNKSGVDIPEEIVESGLAGLASYGLKAISGLRFEDAEPLLEEMMTCIQIRPDPKQPDVLRSLWEEDIEEVATRLRLRSEVFKLHVSFSEPGGGLTTPGSTSTGTHSKNTGTSHIPSAP
jgi:hypothetical protein